MATIGGGGNRLKRVNENIDAVLKALEEENKENLRQILTSDRSYEDIQKKLDKYEKRHSERLAFVLQGGYVNGCK